MSISISNKGLNKTIKSIRSTVKAAQVAQMRAVNRVAAKARTAGSAAVRDQVKLPAAYVNENLTITQKATIQKPESIISGRAHPTRLARYGAKQVTVSAKAARGDELRRIPAGRKQKGIRVQVKPGRVRAMDRAFFLPLKNQNGLMGVFTRTGSGPKDIKHHYGPSVDQVFKSVRKQLLPMIRRELVTEFRSAFRFARSQQGV